MRIRLSAPKLSVNDIVIYHTNNGYVLTIFRHYIIVQPDEHCSEFSGIIIISCVMLKLYY